MSIHCQSIVWRWQNLSHSQKLVLVYLAGCAHHDGTNAFPAIATIARECCLSERGTRHLLGQLVDKGCIYVLAEHDPGRRRPTNYAINLDWPTEQDREEQGASTGRNAAPSGGNLVQQGGNEVPPNLHRTVKDVSDASASADAAGARLAAPPNFKAILWKEGVAWLRLVTGQKETTVRGKIGMWCRDYGAGAVASALIRAQDAQPAEPVAFIMRILKTDAERGPPGRHGGSDLMDAMDRWDQRLGKGNDDGVNDGSRSEETHPPALGRLPAADRRGGA